jgi:hypothetical protein
VEQDAAPSARQSTSATTKSVREPVMRWTLHQPAHLRQGRTSRCAKHSGVPAVWGGSVNCPHMRADHGVQGSPTSPALRPCSTTRSAGTNVNDFDEHSPI